MTKRKALKIERGIPIPPTANAANGHITELLCALKIGESILLPMYTRSDQLGSIRANVQARARSRLVTRVVKGGVRVWRFA